MKTDKHKTKVRFLYHESNKDLLAFFPKERYNNIEPKVFASYSHIGQHSGCHLDYANECREATKEEYKDLQTELESRGYNLEILTD